MWNLNSLVKVVHQDTLVGTQAWWNFSGNLGSPFPRDRSELGANGTKEEQCQSSSYKDRKVFLWILVFFSQAEGLRQLEN